MTSDKQNTGHLAKPFTPTLSAAFHRSSKTPLTPKLASPAAGYRTPKRLAPSEHPSSTPTTTTTTTPSSKDDYQSPANFLSANVTPRSNSRTTRRDISITSSTSTPNIPNAPPYAQPVVAPGSQNGGGYRTERSPVRAGVKLEPPRPSRARTLTTESNQQSSRPIASPDVSGSPRFFHASDARTSNSPDPDSRVKPPLSGKQPSSATFFYADGKEERPAPGEEANLHTIPVAKRRSTGLSRSAIGVKPPTTSTPSPRLRTKGNDFSPRLSDSVPSLPGPHLDSPENSSPRPNLSLGNLSDRPPPVPVVRHMKSSSLDSGTSGNLPREGLRPSPLIVSPSDPQVDASAAASEPLPGLRPRVFSDGSNASGDSHSPASPVKSDVTAQANDPAASARVERKIMDLEISNSSLLAINRTLEREMRKQNAELRRYRRLSRTGRISMTPVSRSVSGTALSTTTEVEEGVSEMSSVRSPDELSDFSDEEEDSADEGVMSPGSLAESDARHRERDEKRVFIDLAKHREQLVESQKMNQSLRRCLGWTEELIKEGQKALEYNVHVNDVELGGRVLAPEELQDIGESARGLLSSTSELRLEELPIDQSEPEPEPEQEPKPDSTAETA